MDRAKNQSILAINKKNIERILELNKGKNLSKMDKLRLHLLKGYILTGWIMTENFNVFSYRDAIYDLRKQGMAIEGKTIIKNGVQHQEKQQIYHALSRQLPMSMRSAVSTKGSREQVYP